MYLTKQIKNIINVQDGNKIKELGQVGWVEGG